MKSIAVKNYRSIKDSGELELRPLTAIVGRNSAGKSSLVRLIPLLKQTVERKTSEPILWYGDYVDFGDYQHTISRNSDGEPIIIAFSLDMTSNSAFSAFSDNNDEMTVKVELCIREKYVDQVSIWFEDQHIVIKSLADGMANLCINGDENSFAKEKYRWVKLHGGIVPLVLPINKDNEVDYSIWRSDSQSVINFYNRYIYPENKQVKNTNRRYGFETIRIASKTEILTQLVEINENKFKKMKISFKRFEKINNHIIAFSLARFIFDINEALERELRATNYLKPIRAMVDRYYRIQGISIDEVDADGSNLPMILHNMKNSELVAFESWSKKTFGVVFSVTTSDGHISLVVRNEVGGEILTNVADTGYGYSQMLPIVMLLWKIHNSGRKDFQIRQKTIVIEQPELHLHPAFQARLIDVFVSAIKEAELSGFNLKIIFETHSEAMINRIGMQIGEGAIDADKVNILVFEKIEDIANVTTKTFDKDGLLVGWPIGFFSQSED